MQGTSTASLRTAARHFHSGQLQEAEAICRTLLDAGRDEVEANHLLALIEKKLGRLDAAESAFRACIEKAPDRADILANFGNLLRGLGRHDDAIDAYRRALDGDASFRPARIALARALLTVGNYEEAIAQAQRLLAANVNDAEAWNVIGVARRSLHDEAAAEDAFRNALAHRPDYAAAEHNLGALLAKQSRLEAALEHLTRSAQLGAGGTELVWNMSSTLAGLNRFEESEALLRRAIRQSPKAIDLHRQLARLRYVRGDTDFDSEIRDAIRAAPGYAPLSIAYAQLLRAAGRFDDAFETLGQVRGNETYARALDAELAALNQEAGNFEQALKHAQSVADGAQDFGAHIDLIIDPLLSLGRADEAVPYIRTARQHAPLNQAYIAHEATAARVLGDPRYEELFDYDRFVRCYEVPVPDGWPSADAFRSDLNSALVARHRLRAQPLDQSLRGGTQTPRGLLGDDEPVIVAFLKALTVPISEYLQDIGADDRHPMTSRNTGKTRMTGCWSARLKRGGYHVNHVHPEGWISSAYYAEVPEEVNDDNLKSGWIKFGEPRFFVPGATPAKYVKPVAGMLVLFPSYMWHGTTPIRSTDPRMTIAFDAVPDPSATADG